MFCIHMHACTLSLMTSIKLNVVIITGSSSALLQP